MHSPLVSVIYALAALLAGSVLLSRPARDERGEVLRGTSRRWLYFGALVGFLPLMAMAVFAEFEWMPVRLMPIGLWAEIEREYWMPFAVLFFACAAQLMPNRNRRALRYLTLALVPFVIIVTGWRFLPQPMMDFGRNMHDGVCIQSSDYTCGAASLVTLLNTMGIEATEGEMAHLSGTIPGRGVSDFQAANGLRRKLEQLGRKEHAAILPFADNDPTSLTQPFLAGMKHSFFFDHMICVLTIDKQRGMLTVGDPLGGRHVMSMSDFKRDWRGYAIVAE